MADRIGTVYARKLNEGFSFRFCVGSLVWHETPEEGRGTYRPKCCEYYNKNGVNSPNILTNNY